LNQPEASDGWITEDALWLVSKTVSDKLRAHLLSLGVDGIPASNTAVFNVLQDHGMLQPTPDGKAVWRATVTSTTGWSHSFTLLRLAPALIWESGERPAPFAGAVAIDGTPAPNNADALVPSPAMTAKPATDDQESLPWEGVDAATPVHLPAAQAAPDVMEDLLAMVGIGDLLVPQQDAEAVSGDAPAAGPQTPPPTSMVPVPSSAPVPTSSSAQPSGEHFMAWLKQGIATRRLVINDAKALVH
ncbi:TraI domain-containing protein, partial [Pseudomonas aeruginosa]